MKRKILSIIFLATLNLTACAQNTLKVPVVTYDPYTYLEDVERTLKHPNKKPHMVLKDSTMISKIRYIEEYLKTKDVFAVNLEKESSNSQIQLFGFREDNGVIRYVDFYEGKMFHSLDLLIESKYGSLVKYIELFPENVQYKLLTSPSGMYSFVVPFYTNYIISNNYMFYNYTNEKAPSIVEKFLWMMKSALENVDKEALKSKLEEWANAHHAEFALSVLMGSNNSSNLAKERESLYLCGSNAASFLKEYLGAEVYHNVHNIYLQQLSKIRAAVDYMRTTDPNWQNDTKEKDYKEVLKGVDEVTSIMWNMTRGDRPKFQGGDPNNFPKWIRENANYPKDVVANIKGRMTLQFRIDVFGNVVDVKMLRGLHPALDAEALRVVSSSPKWTPVKDEHGNLGSYTYTLPILFPPKN